MPTPVVPALLSAVLLSLQFVTSSALNTATAKDTRPNIVYIMTVNLEPPTCTACWWWCWWWWWCSLVLSVQDDQDIELGGLTPMNKVPQVRVRFALYHWF